VRDRVRARARARASVKDRAGTSNPNVFVTRIVLCREYVAETLGVNSGKASLLPDSLCSRLYDSIKVLEKAVDEYG
jgi:hypothetical protein